MWSPEAAQTAKKFIIKVKKDDIIYFCKENNDPQLSKVKVLGSAGKNEEL